jgi:transglutaminase-like putative cysteine protease
VTGDSSRLSWVEDGSGVDAPLAPWVMGVVSCAVAVAGAVEDPPQAAGAALVLVAGAVAGRALRLQTAFGSTSAWMWAIAGGTLAFLAGGWPAASAVGLALSLFVLPLDWRSVTRLRAAVGAGLVFATLAIVGPAERNAVFALWAPLAAVTLLLIERTVRGAGRQAAAHRPPGAAVPPHRADTRTGRDALALTGVALVAVVLALVVLPPPAPVPAAGRPGQGGESDPTYWGFGSALDTATRAPRGDEVVLRVQATTPALWRGDSFDRFDGRRWTHGTRTPVPLRPTDRLTVPPAAFPGIPRGAAPVEIPTEDQVQVFTFERGGNDLVFAANRPDAVLVAPTGATWFAEADAVQLDEPLGRGGSYTVVSSRPRVTEGLLRSLEDTRVEAMAAAAEAAARPARRRPTDPFPRFLEVPSSTTPRTRELAERVTAGAASAYDKIRALEAWLAANTTYKLDIPPLPPGRDAVDQFLFEDRQGYCEQIASALAILLRVAGVPARLAVGFVPDGQDPASGDWVVRDRNAHAWVEVWWPGVGWQGFDPTADVPLAPDAGVSTASDRLTAVLPAAAGALVLLGAGAVAVAFSPGRRRWWRRRAAPDEATARRRWVAGRVTRLERAGRRVGRPRRPDETLIEYARSLEEPLADPSGLTVVAARDAAAVLSQVAFGDGPLAPATRAGVDRWLTDVEAGARRVERDRRRARWRGRRDDRTDRDDALVP